MFPEHRLLLFGLVSKRVLQIDFLVALKMVLRVSVHIVRKIINGTEHICLDTIKMQESEVYFAIPLEFQPRTYHSELFSLSTIQSAEKNLTKQGHYRNLKVSLNEELQPMYVDEDLNFVFQGEYLEEVKVKETEKATPFDNFQSILLETLKQIGVAKPSREPYCPLTNVEKKFSIAMFDGKQHATFWLSDFEEECNRHEIVDDETKIKCMKLFLKDTAEEWYSANSIRLPKNDWSQWSTSFKRVFSEKSWSKIRYAYSFKFISGSMINYAIKKERMLLEVEKGMTTGSRINLIVLGLPIHIQNKLDRENIEDTDDLMNKLGQYDLAPQTTFQVKQLSRRMPEEASTSYKKLTQGKLIDTKRKPCTICESLNFPGRFHPQENCRNKNKLTRVNQVNLNQVLGESSSESEHEYSDNKKN